MAHAEEPPVLSLVSIDRNPIVDRKTPTETRLHAITRTVTKVDPTGRWRMASNSRGVRG